MNSTQAATCYLQVAGLPGAAGQHRSVCRCQPACGIVIDARMQAAGMDAARIRELTRPVALETRQLTKTGEKVRVPAKRIPYFKPGKELKRLINGTG